MNEVSNSERKQMSRHVNLDRLTKTAAQEEPKHASFATTADAACYLRLNSRRVRDVLEAHGAPLNPAGRVRWATLWMALWHIPEVPETAYDMMMRPLLTVAEVADRVGVTERSILRNTDRQRSRYGLPRHVQLSERARRFHPMMILAWEMQEPIEDWMQATAQAPRLPRGLRPRLVRSDSRISPAESQSSDHRAGIGRNDNRSF